MGEEQQFLASAPLPPGQCRHSTSIRMNGILWPGHPGKSAWVREVEPSHTGTERRRSERIAQSLPVVVRGIDLLGQPFEERSSTLNLNLHGCRYASKYHLPKNTWVTLEIPHGAERENVRAPHGFSGPARFASCFKSPLSWKALEISGRSKSRRLIGRPRVAVLLRNRKSAELRRLPRLRKGKHTI